MPPTSTINQYSCLTLFPQICGSTNDEDPYPQICVGVQREANDHPLTDTVKQAIPCCSHHRIPQVNWRFTHTPHMCRTRCLLGYT